MTHDLRQEALRKSLHALGCVWAVWGLYWPVLPIAGLGFFALLYTIYESARLRGHWIAIIERLGRALRRQHEATRPALGPVSLALGFVVCFFIFEPWIASAATLAACACDCAAGLGGRVWGRRPLPWLRHKTLEGTAAGFVASIIAATPVAGFPVSLIAGVVASIVEALPLEELDNILVPVVTACVLVLCFG